MFSSQPKDSHHSHSAATLLSRRPLVRYSSNLSFNKSNILSHKNVYLVQFASHPCWGISFSAMLKL